MKTAISIPDPLFHAAEQLARRLGLSRSEVFQRAVLEYLRAHKDAGVTDALNQVYGPGRESGRLDAALERFQAASLPDEDW